MPSEPACRARWAPGERARRCRIWGRSPVASGARCRASSSWPPMRCIRLRAGSDAHACRLAAATAACHLLSSQADPGREGGAVPQHRRGVHPGAGGTCCRHCCTPRAWPAPAVTPHRTRSRPPLTPALACWLALPSRRPCCSPRSCGACWSASPTSWRTTASSPRAACTSHRCGLRRHQRVRMLLCMSVRLRQQPRRLLHALLRRRMAACMAPSCMCACSCVTSSLAPCIASTQLMQQTD